jgi:hypothetical protein
MKNKILKAVLPIAVRDFQEARQRYLNCWESLTAKDDDVVEEMLRQAKRIIDHLHNENPDLLNEFLCGAVKKDCEEMSGAIKKAAALMGGGAQKIFRDRSDDEFDGWDRFDIFWDCWLA